MSVIIRLQNLPWSANSLDIRGFFRGLSIPDGGVHIVGGEMGDAFIAFSTDEDARQAMMMNGCKIKEVGVKLLLSSRAEMQKVIETAQQSSTPFLQLAPALPQAPVLPAQLPSLIAQQLYNHQMTYSSNTFKLNDKNKPFMNDSMRQNNMMGMSGGNKYNKDSYRDRRDKRDRYRRNSRSSSRSSSSDRGSRSRSRDRSRRDRSRSREKRDKRRDRRSWSRDSDDHSRSSDGRNNRKMNNSNNNGKPGKVWNNSGLNENSNNGSPNSNFSSSSNNFKNRVNTSNTQPVFMSNSVNLTPDELKKIQNLKDKRNDSAFQTFNHQRSIDLTSDDTGLCVKVSNLELPTGYGDIRRFFHGLPIPNNGIKMLNDGAGHRIGVALVQFTRSDHRKMAVEKSGTPLNGSNAQVSSIDDSEFQNAVDSFRPTYNFNNDNYDGFKKGPKQPIIPNKEFTALKIIDLPSLTKEQDVMRLFSDYALLHIIVAKDKNKNKKLCAYVKFHRAEDARKALLEKSSFTMAHKTVYVTVCDDNDFDEALKSNIIEEHEVEIVQSPPQTSGDEKNEEKELRKRNRSSRWDTSSQDSVIEIPPEVEAPITRPVQQEISPAMDPRLQNIRDPRLLISKPPPIVEPQTQQEDEEEEHYNNMNQEQNDELTTDCVVVSNLAPICTDMDVANFFNKAGIQPMRVHILLDNFGNPSGDCFVEFSSTEEVMAALNESEQYLGDNQIYIEPIPREEVNEVLSSFMKPPATNKMQPSQQKPQFHPRGVQQPQFQPRMPHQNPNFNMKMNGNNPMRPFMPRRPPFNPRLQQQMMCESDVLKLENVPYRAGVEDIMAFFGDFNIRPQDVMRRYNDMGQTTGEAKVRFQSPVDAMRALEQLSMQKINGRTIYLSMDN